MEWFQNHIGQKKKQEWSGAMSNIMERDEWLAKRRVYLGASEVAAVLGMSPFAGQLDVYASKVMGDRISDNDAMKYGRDVEGAIAKMYAGKTGREIKDLGATKFQIHPDISFLGATLDRLIVSSEEHDTEGPLELKSVGARFVDEEEWQEDPPLHYQIQTQVQMSVIGASWGALAGLFPGYKMIHKDMDFDKEFFNAAVPVLEEFWHRVETKNPPPVDGSPKALETVKRVYNRVDPSKMVALPTSLLTTISEWETLKKQATETDKQAKEIEARLRDIMKDAEFGVLPDGRFLSLKETTRKGYIVSESKYRTLRVTKNMK